ncbi:hypothetical protein IWZ01DRAFT_221745 [Phyllosticta capitalensis]
MVASPGQFLSGGVQREAQGREIQAPYILHRTCAVARLDWLAFLDWMHALLASQTQCRGKANGHPEWRWRPLVRRGDWLSGDEQGTVHGQLCIRSFSSSTLKHPPISTVASLNTFSPPSPSPFEPSFTRRLFSGQSSGQRGTYVHNSFHKTPSPSVLILTRPDLVLLLPLRAGPHRRDRFDCHTLSHSLPPLASSGLRSARLRALNCPACRVCVRSCNGPRSTLPLSTVLLRGSRPTRQPSASSASTAGTRIQGPPHSQNSWFNGNFPHSPNSLTSDPDPHPSADSLIRALPPENTPLCRAWPCQRQRSIA